MAAYVIKSWRSNNTPDSDGNYVLIEGRREGLVSWLLSLFKIEPTVMIRVTQDRIEFAEGSLAGNVRRIIPMLGVCSTLYGYQKPWQKAVALLVVLAWFGGMLGAFVGGGAIGGAGAALGGLAAVVVAAVVAVIYYYLNKTLTLGFVENSGVINIIQFKRSVIEGQQIDEQQAGFVGEIVQFLIETKLRSTRTP